MYANFIELLSYYSQPRVVNGYESIVNKSVLSIEKCFCRARSIFVQRSIFVKREIFSSVEKHFRRRKFFLPVVGRDYVYAINS